jgi:hypothetical protein
MKKVLSRRGALTLSDSYGWRRAGGTKMRTMWGEWPGGDVFEVIYRHIPLNELLLGLFNPTPLPHSLIHSSQWHNYYIFPTSAILPVHMCHGYEHIQHRYAPFYLVFM